MRGGRIHIGEITPPATRYQYLLAGTRGVINHQHALSALPCGQSAHQAGPAGTQDNRIIIV
jgi:hypothetical protein